MHQSRMKPKLQHQGHQMQIFTDLSPSTIQKRRSLKPLLTVLAQGDIKYHWAFPFAVKFINHGKTHSFSNLLEVFTLKTCTFGGGTVIYSLIWTHCIQSSYLG